MANILKTIHSINDASVSERLFSIYTITGIRVCPKAIHSLESINDILFKGLYIIVEENSAHEHINSYIINIP